MKRIGGGEIYTSDSFLSRLFLFWCFRGKIGVLRGKGIIPSDRGFLEVVILLYNFMKYLVYNTKRKNFQI